MSNLILNMDRRGIPDSMQEGLARYIERGIEAGSFLSAVLSNNLKETYANADNTNAYCVRNYVMFLYNDAPKACWGSPEKVQAWILKGGLRG